MEVLDKVLSRLIAFRDEVVAKDMIVPMWVNDSIEEIEAAQQSPAGQRTTCTHPEKKVIGAIPYCKVCGEQLD